MDQRKRTHNQRLARRSLWNAGKGREGKAAEGEDVGGLDQEIRR